MNRSIIRRLVIPVVFTSLLMPRSQAQSPVYRDLNKNGKMDVYEDPILPAEIRVADLLSRMTLEEKVGEMFQTYAMMDKNGSVNKAVYLGGGTSLEDMIAQKHITHFNLVGDGAAVSIARFNNLLQQIAADTRLGIPVTLSSDPRNSFRQGDMATVQGAGDMTVFPDPIGLAATRDTLLVEQMGRIIAREYRAVGLSMALSPMADLSTEPRWSRINGTFGEDAEVASSMVRAYIRGFQGQVIDSNSVACMVKHFPGGGPQKDGWESHFSYGRYLVYPGHRLEEHLRPFQAAFSVGCAGLLTNYGIPVGQTRDSVAISFNREMLTDLLRHKLGYNGIVVSDWNTLTAKSLGAVKITDARSWGVDSLSLADKLVKQVLAGVDQIGGENCTELLVDLVKKGVIPTAIVDGSVKKILLLKFRLGLFDHPFVDESRVAGVVGEEASHRISYEIQQKSLVLLANPRHFLPLKKGIKLYVEHFDRKAFAPYAQIVDSIDQCDVALIHLSTPFGKGLSNMVMERYFHQGRLDFPDSVLQLILAKCKAKPTIIVINLERPAVIPEIAAQSAALIGDFGISEKPLIGMLFGDTKPSGKLPFELPSSMEAVRQQKEDVPHDSLHPLFDYGFGLTNL